MGDDQQSAGELRQRYSRNGTAKDDELTASQLRSRHGIPKNSGGKSHFCYCIFYASYMLFISTIIPLSFPLYSFLSLNVPLMSFIIRTNFIIVIHFISSLIDFSTKYGSEKNSKQLVIIVGAVIVVLLIAAFIFTNFINKKN